LSIHSEHPFVPPSAGRNPARRLRGRLPAPVTVWTAERGDRRSGLTVSSMLVADGEPARVLALIDPDSDLADRLVDGGVLAISLLTWRHRGLADQFAGTAPAPGGPFARTSWTDTAWGPVLADAAGWAGARVELAEVRQLGWSLLIPAQLERVELPDDAEPVLAHRQGRYQRG
jgi:flavin reductase (DIM6/NTAB) family NADH-FMN oxidoreductase RutF